MLYSEIQIQTLSRFFPTVVKAKRCCSFDDALFALVQKMSHRKKKKLIVATPYSWAEIKNRNTREGWSDEWKDVDIKGPCEKSEGAELYVGWSTSEIDSTERLSFHLHYVRTNEIRTSTLSFMHH